MADWILDVFANVQNLKGYFLQNPSFPCTDCRNPDCDHDLDWWTVWDSDEECEDAESMKKVRAKYKFWPQPYVPPSKGMRVEMSITRILCGFSASRLNEILEEDSFGFTSFYVYAHWPVRFIYGDSTGNIIPHWSDPTYWSTHSFTQEMIDEVCMKTYSEWSLHTECHLLMYQGYKDGKPIPLPPLDSDLGWWINLN